jgi:hypothetical protein
VHHRFPARAPCSSSCADYGLNRPLPALTTGGSSLDSVAIVSGVRTGATFTPLSPESQTVGERQQTNRTSVKKISLSALGKAMATCELAATRAVLYLALGRTPTTRSSTSRLSGSTRPRTAEIRMPTATKGTTASTLVDVPSEQSDVSAKRPTRWVLPARPTFVASHIGGKEPVATHVAPVGE